MILQMIDLNVIAIKQMILKVYAKIVKLSIIICWMNKIG